MFVRFYCASIFLSRHAGNMFNEFFIIIIIIILYLFAVFIYLNNIFTTHDIITKLKIHGIKEKVLLIDLLTITYFFRLY